MNNSIWKLTALTGVIGLGCLMIFWAQQGLTNPEPDDSNTTVANNSEPENPSSQIEQDKFVSSGQQEPGSQNPEWENVADQSLTSNREPTSAGDDKPTTLDEHLSQQNSHNVVGNPFTTDSGSQSFNVKQANRPNTQMENNPFEDKTKTANYNDPTNKNESTKQKVIPVDFQKKNQKTTTKSEGPVFLAEEKLKTVPEKKPEFEKQKTSTSEKTGNPFTNDEKPVLLNREPVKTKSKTDVEKSSTDYFPKFELKNLQKSKPGNPFDTKPQDIPSIQKLLEVPLPESNNSNQDKNQDKNKSNPFATKDSSKKDSPIKDTAKKDTPKYNDQLEMPILPQKDKALKETPVKTLQNAPPAFIEDDPKHSTKANTENGEPQKLEIIGEKSQKPQLVIEKIAPKQAILGESMVYRITVKNIGQSPAYDVVVEDVVSKDVNLTGTIPQARLNNETLFWKLGTLKPGDFKKILVKVVPKKEGQISSNARVKFTSKVASKTKVAAPKLKFQLQGPDKAELGSKITYRYQIDNIGTVPVKNVWVRGLLPNQLSHPAGSDIESQIGTLKAGASKIITLYVKAHQSGSGIHRAILTASGNIRLESQSAIVVSGEKVKLTRYGPQSRPIGKPAVFTNMVTNKTQQTIKNVVVTEKVPKGMKFVEATEGGQFDPARRTVNWPLKNLKPKESKSLKIKLIPRVRGKYHSDVKVVDKSGTLSNSTSNFEINGYALLRMEIPATKGLLEVGDTVSMTVTIRNMGTSDASNMKLRILVPPELKLLDIKGPEKFRRIGKTVEVNPLANIPAGKSATFEIQLRATKIGDSRLGVHIQSDEMQKPLKREEAIVVLPQ